MKKKLFYKLLLFTQIFAFYHFLHFFHSEKNSFPYSHSKIDSGTEWHFKNAVPINSSLIKIRPQSKQKTFLFSIGIMYLMHVAVRTETF